MIRSPAGMRFVAWLVELSGANMLSFEPGSDVNAGVFFEGRRSIGLCLLSMVHAKGTDEAAYHKAVMERNDLRRQDARDLKGGADADGTPGQPGNGIDLGRWWER